MIVEDDSGLRANLAEYLSMFFHEVLQCGDTQEAYRIYREKSPDVIFSDIELPTQTGLELISKIRKEDDKTQIVIISAHKNEEYLTSAIELGLISYLIKPITSQKLKETVNKCKKKLQKQTMLGLNDGFAWDASRSVLYKRGEEIQLTTTESRFLQLLCQKKGECVSYEDIHNYIYDLEDFSKNALSSLVKRIRQKTSKELIGVCFGHGYKIKA